MNYKSSVIITFLILFLSFFSYFVPSLKTQSNENRTMATFNMIVNPNRQSIVYNSNPVERLEAALSDQFAFRENFIRVYLNLFNFAENTAVYLTKLLIPSLRNQHTLTSIGKYQTIEDTGYVIEYPATKPLNKEVIQTRMDQLELLHKKYPNLKFYIYYVTQGNETGWFDKSLGITTANHYQELLDIKPSYVKAGHLVYKDLDDYVNIHYKTDHHWNHIGAIRGYNEIYAMLREDFNLSNKLVPTEEAEVSKMHNFAFLGSYGRNLGKLFDTNKFKYDDFSFYEFNLPERKLSVINPENREEIAVTKLNLKDEYKRGGR